LHRVLLPLLLHHLVLVLRNLGRRIALLLVTLAMEQFVMNITTVDAPKHAQELVDITAHRLMDFVATPHHQRVQKALSALTEGVVLLLAEHAPHSLVDVHVSPASDKAIT
jgi:hypothetical protein